MAKIIFIFKNYKRVTNDSTEWLESKQALELQQAYANLGYSYEADILSINK